MLNYYNLSRLKVSRVTYISDLNCVTLSHYHFFSRLKAPSAVLLFVCLFMYTASVMFDYYCRDSELSYIGGDWVPIYTSFGGSWGL